MKIYWTMNAVSELDGLEPSEKRKRYRELLKEGRKHIGAMPYVYTGIAALVIYLLAMALDLWGILMAGVVGGCIGAAFVIFVQTPSVEHGRVWYRDRYGSH